MNEETRQRQIRLLSHLAAATIPLTTADDSTPDLDDADMMMLRELKIGGFISGQPTSDSAGNLVRIDDMAITVSGRKYLAELQQSKWNGFYRRIPVWKLVISILAATAAALALLLR